jgi:hypothetical protein
MLGMLLLNVLLQIANKLGPSIKKKKKQKMGNYFGLPETYISLTWQEYSACLVQDECTSPEPLSFVS